MSKKLIVILMSLSFVGATLVACDDDSNDNSSKFAGTNSVPGSNNGSKTGSGDDSGTGTGTGSSKIGKVCNVDTFSEYCSGSQAIFCGEHSKVEAFSCLEDEYCLVAKDFWEDGLNYADCYMDDYECSANQEGEEVVDEEGNLYECYKMANGKYYYVWFGKEDDYYD